ncbi:MAG: hypothetical protein HQM15_05710 [Deltaproteobacteria bacterium]|nr:hypothetical protein [Deltaproteobacteria bacterium]
MSTSFSKNIHIPLDASIHLELKKIADALKLPLTTLAHMAIQYWIKAKKRYQVQKELAAYVSKHAGSELDMDTSLEKEALKELQKIFEEQQ